MIDLGADRLLAIRAARSLAGAACVAAVAAYGVDGPARSAEAYVRSALELQHMACELLDQAVSLTTLVERGPHLKAMVADLARHSALVRADVLVADASPDGRTRRIIGDAVATMREED